MILNHPNNMNGNNLNASRSIPTSNASVRAPQQYTSSGRPINTITNTAISSMTSPYANRKRERRVERRVDELPSERASYSRIPEPLPANQMLAHNSISTVSFHKRSLPKRPRAEPNRSAVSMERYHSLVVESKLYTQLLELEKQLDYAILHKQLDIQEAIRVKPVRSGKTLRIYVCNTYINQGPFYHADESTTSASSEVPCWTLKIEGAIVEPTQNGSVPPSKKKFTTFIKKLFIQISDKTGAVRDTMEWSKQQMPLLADAMDGFEVKRKGNEELNCKLLLFLDYVPERFRLSPALSSILSLHTETRPRIIMTLWQYIKLHKLQDTEDKQIIHANAELKSIFGLDTMTFANIPSLILEQLLPPEPIEINYTLKLSGDPIDTEEVYDINIDVEDGIATTLLPYGKKELELHDDQLAQCLRSIVDHKTNRDFLLSFAANPVEFLNSLIAAQTRDFILVRSEEGKNSEDERFSTYYHQPLVHDAVSQYLARHTNSTT